MSICSKADVTTWLGLNSSLSEKEDMLLELLIPLAESSLKNFIGFSAESATYTQFFPARGGYNEDEIVGLDVVNNRVVAEYAGGFSGLFLKELPVRSITSIYDDPAAFGGQGASDFPASSLLTSGTDYYLDVDQSGISWSGKVIRRYGTWSQVPRSIKVTYVAGFTAAELDGTATAGIRAVGLRFAAIIAVAHAFKEAVSNGKYTTALPVGPLTAESISTTGHSVTYGGTDVTALYGLVASLPPKSLALAQPFRSYARR
jgi:hypothetical protein